MRPTLIVVLVALVAVLTVLLIVRRGSGRPVDLVGGPPSPRRSVRPDRAQTDEIESLVRRGQTIEAVKLLRERTGLGLREAKNVVDMLAATGGPLPDGDPATAPPTALDGALLDRVRELKRQGKIIYAVKEVRDHTGLSLRDAKEAVDRL